MSQDNDILTIRDLRFRWPGAERLTLDIQDLSLGRGGEQHLAT